MKIALVIYGSLDTLSGGYLYDRRLVHALEQQGDTVQIVSIPWRNYAAHLTDNLSQKLLGALIGGNFDVILQDELNHPSLFLLNRTLRQATSAPLVSIVHHLRSHETHPPGLRRVYAAVETAYLNTIDAFLVNSWTTRRAVEERLGNRATKPKPKCLVAYPAADHLIPPDSGEVQRRIDTECATFGDSEAAQGLAPLDIAFVGNIIPRKSLHTVIQGLALAQTQTGRPLRLHVIGSLTTDPHYAASVRHQIARLKLNDRVYLYGRVDDTQLSQILARCQILAVPSFEGFGIVYLEAMRHGLCPIASTAGAAQEIIRHGFNGLLVRPNAPEQLAAQLSSLAAEPQFLCSLRHAALQAALVHPTWDKTFAHAHQWLCEIKLLQP